MKGKDNQIVDYSDGSKISETVRTNHHIDVGRSFFGFAAASARVELRCDDGQKVLTDSLLRAMHARATTSSNS